MSTTEECLLLIEYLRSHPDLEPEQRETAKRALLAKLDQDIAETDRQLDRQLEELRERWKTQAR